MKYGEQDKKRAFELFKSENPDSNARYFHDLNYDVQKRWLKEANPSLTAIPVTTVRMQFKRTGGNPDGVRSYNIKTHEPEVALFTALELLEEENGDAWTATTELTELTMYFKQEILAHEPR